MQMSSSGYKERRIGQRDQIRKSPVLYPTSSHLPATRVWPLALAFVKPASALGTLFATWHWHCQDEGEILKKHLGHWQSHHWAQQPLLPARALSRKLPPLWKRGAGRSSGLAKPRGPLISALSEMGLWEANTSTTQRVAQRGRSRDGRSDRMKALLRGGLRVNTGSAPLSGSVLLLLWQEELMWSFQGRWHSQRKGLGVAPNHMWPNKTSHFSPPAMAGLDSMTSGFLTSSHRPWFETHTLAWANQAFHGPQKAIGKPESRFDGNRRRNPDWPIRATHSTSLNKVIGLRVTRD